MGAASSWQHRCGLERLASSCRWPQHLVEDHASRAPCHARRRGFVPVAGHRFHALHQRLAAVIAARPIAAPARSPPAIPARLPLPLKRRCDWSAAAAAVCAGLSWTGSKHGFGYAWPLIPPWLRFAASTAEGWVHVPVGKTQPLRRAVRCRSSALAAARREAAARRCSAPAPQASLGSSIGGGSSTAFSTVGGRRRWPSHIPRPEAAADLA